jgi:glycosyltransferase involved in cell wall biosynthesis
LQVWRCAFTYKPDLIHSVGLTSAARHLLRLRPPAPLYLWETTEALPHVKFLDKAIAPLLGGARAVLVPSLTIERNVRATYDYTGEVRVLPFWVDEPARLDGVSTRERSGNFLFAGRLDPDKGFADLFPAFRKVLEQHRDATLTVCGEGAIEPLREMAAGIKGVEFSGPLHSPEFDLAFSRCDALVLPSYHEGYPLCLLDACARGRPVIATSVGSIPEVYGGKDCALLVPPRDPSALAEAMQQVLDEPAEVYQSRCKDARELFRCLSRRAVVDARLAAVYREENLVQEVLPLPADETSAKR